MDSLRQVSVFVDKGLFTDFSPKQCQQCASGLHGCLILYVDVSSLIVCVYICSLNDLLMKTCTFERLRALYSLVAHPTTQHLLSSW